MNNPQQVSEFINFEQMQQQLEHNNSNIIPGQNGFALGGVDLMSHQQEALNKEQIPQS